MSNGIWKTDFQVQFPSFCAVCERWRCNVFLNNISAIGSRSSEHNFSSMQGSTAHHPDQRVKNLTLKIFFNMKRSNFFHFWRDLSGLVFREALGHLFEYFPLRPFWIFNNFRHQSFDSYISKINFLFFYFEHLL